MFAVTTSIVKLTLLAGGLVAALVAVWLRRPRGPRAEDLGPISEQWMADHKRGRDGGY
jgi:hypothetical protein